MYPYECVTVVVKEGFDGLRESCGVCTCRKGIEWLLSYAVVVCGLASMRVAEAVANGKKKCVARRERQVVWCSVNTWGGRHMKMGWAAAAGVRWKLVYRVGTAACLGADGGEGGS